MILPRTFPVLLKARVQGARGIVAVKTLGQRDADWVAVNNGDQSRGSLVRS